MNNKLIDLIIKYNELTPKEKELFSEVIGIKIIEIPTITPRSIEDITKSLPPNTTYPDPYKPYSIPKPYQRYNGIPDIRSSYDKVQFIGNTLYSTPDKDIKY